MRQYDGSNGRISVDPEKITIARVGLLNKMTFSESDRNTIILLRDLTGAYFSEPTRFQDGYLQLLVGGEEPLGRSAGKMASNPRAVLFNQSARDTFYALFLWINNLVAELSSTASTPDATALLGEPAEESPVDEDPARPSPSAPSVADEIAKLAQLRAEGILTDEEFHAGKRKLLGLPQ